MKVGFYYHNSFTQNGSEIFVPGYIGVFIDSVASEVDHLHLFLEEASGQFLNKENDYRLERTNISLHNLGPKSSFVKRLLFPRSILNKVAPYIKDIDAILIRCPSPLAPWLHSAFSKKVKSYPLIVGNYIEGLKHLKQPLFRKLAIYAFTYYYQFLHNKMISQSSVFVNSSELARLYNNKAKNIALIKTTTLHTDSFFAKVDTCNRTTIQVLFTGRINFQKGLRELIQSVANLSHELNIILNIVGWEEEEGDPYTKALKELSSQLGISDRVIFHGKKKIGNELKEFYINADLYVLPTYHEGFPRTIWEAMACCTPVISTTVGSIPDYLENMKNAILVEPQNVNQLTEAMRTIISNQFIRQTLIRNAYEMSKDVTLELQTKLLIAKLKQFIRNE